MEITWFGTATLTFSAGGQSIIFDPFIAMNKKLPRPSYEELSKCGDIFITHGHFDHLVDVPGVLEAAESIVYCSETAAVTLIREGVSQDRIKVVKPGDLIKKGPLKIKVYRGEHIKFDLPLILRTLFSRRAMAGFGRLRNLVRLARDYPQGEVLVYQVEAKGKKVLHMGSLNLSETERYPMGADLLTLPFQGRSDLDTYVLQFIDLLKPKAILLQHTCDSFPPLSSPVQTDGFIDKMAKQYPATKVIIPQYNHPIVL